jgi:hypothetical protein
MSVQHIRVLTPLLRQMVVLPHYMPITVILQYPHITFTIAVIKVYLIFDIIDSTPMSRIYFVNYIINRLWPNPNIALGGSFCL